MLTDELLNRVEQRLNKTGNPSLPPEETLTAILTLGRERDEARTLARSRADDVAELKARLNIVQMQKDDAELQTKQAEDSAKEQAWIAHELGKFVSDTANGLYSGNERAAANRVYDLNKSSLRKKRLNAYNYETLEEAKSAYEKSESDDTFEVWLFTNAVTP